MKILKHFSRTYTNYAYLYLIWCNSTMLALEIKTFSLLFVTRRLIKIKIRKLSHESNFFASESADEFTRNNAIRARPRERCEPREKILQFSDVSALADCVQEGIRSRTSN